MATRFARLMAASPSRTGRPAGDNPLKALPDAGRRSSTSKPHPSKPHPSKPHAPQGAKPPRRPPSFTGNRTIEPATENRPRETRQHQRAPEPPRLLNQAVRPPQAQLLPQPGGSPHPPCEHVQRPADSHGDPGPQPVPVAVNPELLLGRA